MKEQEQLPQDDSQERDYLASRGGCNTEAIGMYVYLQTQLTVQLALSMMSYYTAKEMGVEIPFPIIAVWPTPIAMSLARYAKTRYLNRSD